MNAEEIRDIEAEAGVVASIILNPELTFHSDQLEPRHFSDVHNSYIYWAVRDLARMGIEAADAYNILNVINRNKAAHKSLDDGVITIQSINELIDAAPYIARTSVEDYLLCVNGVLDAALRRDTFKRLRECERLCYNGSEPEIQQKIYTTLDNVMMDFSSAREIPSFAEAIDGYWRDIQSRQSGEFSGAPFKFPTLNNYVTIEPGELVIFGAEAKHGKSMMLLNCACDLLKNDHAVLYIDSELNSRLFTARMLSHLTSIEFRRIRNGDYSEEESKRIGEAIAFLKTRRFTHLYMPIFDQQSVYTAVKKVKHTQGLDTLIVDYFKSSGQGDAFAGYNELGRFVDMVKNDICGSLNTAGLGAAQLTSSLRLADSAKIARNASSIIYILNKTPEEIAQDGEACGNRKLFVALNRNGPQMVEGEYIDLKFNGDIISFEEAQQHQPVTPF